MTSSIVSAVTSWAATGAANAVVARVIAAESAIRLRLPGLMRAVLHCLASPSRWRRSRKETPDYGHCPPRGTQVQDGAEGRRWSGLYGRLPSAASTGPNVTGTRDARPAAGVSPR